MVIYLCYGYRPHTTAVYFERAFRQRHEVYYIGPGYGTKPGYPSNVDLAELVDQGLPMPELIMFIEPGIDFFPRGLEKLNCPTACYLVDVHQSLAVRECYAPFFDHLFIAQRDYVDHFSRLGYTSVHWLPLACDPEIHGNRNLPKLYDVGFVGHINSHRRKTYIEKLSTQFKLNDWTKFYPKEEIGPIYSQSKIIFNCAINGDINMRVFEAMASGSLLLTDRVENGLLEMFQENIHISTYENADDLVAKAQKWLENEYDRQRVAQCGEREVLSKHTYLHRTETILEVIESSSIVHTARIRGMDPGRRHLYYANVYTMLRKLDPVADELKQAHNTGIDFRTKLQLVNLLFRTITRQLNAIFDVSRRIRNIGRKMNGKEIFRKG